MWVVNKKTLELQSVTRAGSVLPWGRRFIWQQGMNIDSHCRTCKGFNADKCEKCKHGFWAVRSIKYLTYTPSEYIIGEVALSGRLIEATKGFRASLAKPLSIVYCKGLTFDQVKAISERYGMCINPRIEREFPMGYKISEALFSAIMPLIAIFVPWYILIARPNLDPEIRGDGAMWLAWSGAVLMCAVMVESIIKNNIANRKWHKEWASENRKEAQGS
jgi:hypothetical protein